MSAQSGQRTIAVANAPCSWGVTDDFQTDAPLPAYRQVLDEIALAGYEGTEFGDWGFLPTEPEGLRSELTRRNLALVGAFVPVCLRDPASHIEGEALAVRTAALLIEAAPPNEVPPVIVLADDASDATRLRMAGRIEARHGLSADQWRITAEGAQRIARAVRERTGLRTAFHHHSATFVETSEELATLLELTDPDLLGVCLDTGHYAYGGGDALEALRRIGPRVWHVHVKDCDGAVLARMRSEGWDYFKAVNNRVFCELGQGVVDLASILDELQKQDYRGWIVVEDEVPPGMGVPLESARRDRAFLRSFGL